LLLCLKNPFDSFFCVQLILTVKEKTESFAVESQVANHLVVVFYIDLNIVAFYKNITKECVGCVNEKGKRHRSVAPACVYLPGYHNNSPLVCTNILLQKPGEWVTVQVNG
jgi:hypothetical protein